MNYHFHPEALHEYAEATRYYADISTSLAKGFVTQVENGINLICLYPQTWQPIEEDIRRCLVKRFPFGIYYTIEESESIVIQAVMHLSRKPDYWKARLIK
ncbi:MAG: type II toxin-antitoxin system RelE/ParE family toxin [Nitrospirae bacterium]|nr:type II toxin-antitoxin system RelE/ParE family toxin [Nitrospirota bacterium]